jgi:integrase
MARIYKQARSPYYFADYSLPDGTRRRVSTKKTEKETALAFLTSLITAEKMAREEKLTEQRARELIAEIVERTTGERLDFYTVKAWFEEWAKGKALSKAEGTGVRYKQAVDDFIASLKGRADKNLEALRLKDIQDFFKAERDAGKSVQTVAMQIKVIKSALRAAVRQGVRKDNPAEAFEFPAEADAVEREIFAPEEVASLIGAAEGDDWPGVIRLSFFTGMRLGDCVNLKWECVDLARKVIVFVPQKTARRAVGGRKPKTITVPLHAELETALSAMPGADGSPKAFVFPSLAGKTSGGRSGLSMAFSRIMERAGVVSAVRREATGEKGRAVRARTFHSLRHSFVTSLANAGVSMEHRRLLAGHTEEAMTAHYTHDQTDQLRQAMAKLPGLAEGKKEGGK